jgi:predicted nucleic acid-binding protein
VGDYLADTSAWNRSQQVFERWTELTVRDEIVLCAPVRLELLDSARGSREYRAFRAELRGFRDLRVDGWVTDFAEIIQTRLAVRSAHRRPTAVDLLVAATAGGHGAILLHYDRHYDAIARVTGQPTEWIARRGSLD